MIAAVWCPHCGLSKRQDAIAAAVSASAGGAVAASAKPESKPPEKADEDEAG
jgi:hypothetical protein